MAFAQYYYDPALEFERLLDDHGGQAVGLPVPSPESGSVAAQRTMCGQDRVAYVPNRFVINDVVLIFDGSMQSSSGPSAAPCTVGQSQLPLLLRWPSRGSSRS